MPVTKTSIVGSSSSNSGAGRWIGQRSSPFSSSPWSIGCAEDVEDPAERRLADGDGDRRAGVLDLHATREAVRGVHRHGADAVIAEMLLHLHDQVDRGAPALLGDLDAQRVEDLRELLVEDGVDDDAPDLDDLADVLLALAFSHKELPALAESQSIRAPSPKVRSAFAD